MMTTDTIDAFCGGGKPRQCLMRVPVQSTLVAPAWQDRIQTEIAIPEAVGDDCRVRLPDLSVGGRKLDAPTIEFRGRVRGTICVACA